MLKKLLIASIFFLIITAIIAGASLYFKKQTPALAQTANTYYINATSGNNNNDGLSEATAWQTINKVNSSNFNPGDSILFKRGEVWRETLTIPSSGNSTNQIIFGSYGIGAKPIFIGSEAATSWTNLGSNIWSSAVSNNPTGIWFMNFNGSINWCKKESNQGNLNAEYECYWSTNTLYIYSPSDPDTRYNSVEASTRGYGVTASSESTSYVTVQDIELRFTNNQGVKVPRYSMGWIVQNVESHHNGGVSFGDGSVEIGDSIAVYGSNAMIRNNIVYESGRHCIYSGSTGGQTITGNIYENNIIYNCYHNQLDLQNTNGTHENITVRYNKIYFTNNAVPGHSPSGIFIQGVSGYIVNGIDIYYNILSYNPNQGMHISFYSTNINIYNNVIYASQKTNYGGSLYLNNGTYSATVKNNIGMNGEFSALGQVTDSTNKTINYNCWYQTPDKIQRIAEIAGTRYSDWNTYKNTTGFDANSIWGNDVLFTKADTDLSVANFALQSGSPCIDAGTNLGLTRDIAGNIVPQGATFDIGAYEYVEAAPPPSLTGDFNSDSKVNDLDFTSFKNAFKSIFNAIFDLNSDNAIDVKDLGVLMSGWLP